MSTNARENRIFWDDRQSQYGAAEITYLWSVPSSFRCDRTSHNRAHSHMLDILNFFLCSVLMQLSVSRPRTPQTLPSPAIMVAPTPLPLPVALGLLEMLTAGVCPPQRKVSREGVGQGHQHPFHSFPAPLPQLVENTFQALKKREDS